MKREALKALVDQLALEFKRRQMGEHLQHLMAWFKNKLRTGAGVVVISDSGVWDDELTKQWAKTFRIPPFDATEVRPQTSHCPCGDVAPGGVVATVFPGGSFSRCGKCGREWVTYDNGMQ